MADGIELLDDCVTVDLGVGGGEGEEEEGKADKSNGRMLHGIEPESLVRLTRFSSDIKAFADSIGLLAIFFRGLDCDLLIQMVEVDLGLSVQLYGEWQVRVQSSWVLSSYRAMALSIMRGASLTAFPDLWSL